MKEIVFSDRAIEDLSQICNYWEARNPAIARRVLDSLRTKIELLAKFSYLGFARDDLLLNLRCLVVGDYQVLYEPKEDVIEIVHVRHRAQSEPNLFPF